MRISETEQVAGNNDLFAASLKLTRTGWRNECDLVSETYGEVNYGIYESFLQEIKLQRTKSLSLEEGHCNGKILGG